jgi:hypothetical protein
MTKPSRKVVITTTNRPSPSLQPLAQYLLALAHALVDEEQKMKLS